MLRSVLLLLTAVFFTAPVLADNGVINLPSANGYEDTVQKFKSALATKGLKPAFELDHQANAKRVGLTMHKACLILFGNPKMGTPLMEASPTIGLDLPLKVLIWEDHAGKVFVTYNDPGYLEQRHHVTGKAALFNKMKGALESLTASAVKP